MRHFIFYKYILYETYIFLVPRILDTINQILSIAQVRYLINTSVLLSI